MSAPRHSDWRIQQEQRRWLEEERQRKLAEERRRQEERIKEERRRREEEERKRREEERRRIEELKKQELDRQIASNNEHIDALVNELQALGAAELEKFQEQNFTTQRLTDFVEAKALLLGELKDIPRKAEKRTELRLGALVQLQLQLISSVKSRMQSISAELPILEQEAYSHKVGTAEQSFLNMVNQGQGSGRQVIDLSREASHTPKQAGEQAIDLFAQMESMTALVQPFLDHPFFNHHQEVTQLLASSFQIIESAALNDEDKQKQIVLRRQALQSTLNDYHRQIEQRKQEWSKYETLLVQYESLCALLEKEPDPKWRAMSLSLFVPAYLQDLIDLNEAVEQERIRKTEMEYIADSVHEVMTRLGYRLKYTDMMETPKQTVDHQMYEINKDIAFNVFTSDNGTVLFEVTGVSQGPQVPNDLERKYITQQMAAVCANYPEIREELKKKGVYLENETLKLPEEQYARKIDVSGKEVHDESSAVAGKRKKKRSNHSAQNQTIRREMT